MLKRLVLVSVVLLLLVGCAARKEREEVITYLEEVSDILDRWQDAYELAGQTSRISLSGPISDLQAIRRDLEDLDPPEKAERLHYLTNRAMNYSIDGYLAFVGQESDSEVQELFEEANQNTELALEALFDLQAEYGLE